MDADTPFTTRDSATLQEARRRWSLRDWPGALELFERACRDEPLNARATMEHARALGQRYEVERAEAMLGELASAASLAPGLVIGLAQSYRMIHRPGRALEMLESVRAAGPLPAPVLGELALLYEQFHRLEEAREAIEACLSEAGDQPEPVLVLSRVERLAGSADAARKRLESLLRTPRLTPHLAVRAWYELAAARDAQGDHEAAVEAVGCGKAIQRAGAGTANLLQRNRDVNRYFASLHDGVSPAMLDHWKRAATDSAAVPANVAHLLGFPRSGTTLLEQMLDAHPALVSSAERPVFTREVFPGMAAREGEPVTLESMESLLPPKLAELRSRYLRMMEAMLGEPIGQRLHLDKNPNHTALVPGLVRLFPESKFLCALRDPRDVVVSAYLQYFPLTEFSVAMLTWEGAANQYASDMECGLKMEAWLGDAWLRVKYEDVVASPRRTLTLVLERLGLPWDDAVDRYRDRYRDRQQGSLVHSPSRAAVREAPHSRSIGRWRRYERWLHPVFATLKPYCVALGYDPD